MGVTTVGLQLCFCKHALLRITQHTHTLLVSCLVTGRDVRKSITQKMPSSVVRNTPGWGGPEGNRGKEERWRRARRGRKEEAEEDAEAEAESAEEEDKKKKPRQEH